MSGYSITTVRDDDRRLVEAVDRLLVEEGIKRDRNLDYTCAMLDEEYNVIACGSLYRNSLRCMAVSGRHQGEALMNDIVSHLIEVEYQRGFYHLFIYTKCSTAGFFESLGFKEIARVQDSVVFMENRSSGFRDYIKRLFRESTEQLEKMGLNPRMYLPFDSDLYGETAYPGDAYGNYSKPKAVSAIVMNANPFTRGHRYLIERALEGSELLHLFMVSEDSSLIPFSVRKMLIEEGCKDLERIIFHDSGPYIISSATFPAYFQRDAEEVILSQARLDLEVFTSIAGALGISKRIVGDEPSSMVTALYNRTMQTALPDRGIGCEIIKRLEIAGEPISASRVRQLLRDGDTESLCELLQESGCSFFTSPSAEPIIKRLREAEDVKHY